MFTVVEMMRTIVRLTPCFSIPIFRHNTAYDHDALDTPKLKDQLTGWERVKQMYKKSEYEEMSVELTTVLQATLSGAFIGAGVGGFVTSRVAYINFIENNQATIFKSTADAKKKLQDYVTIAFAKGAYRWGWRLCFFTGMFSLTATTISVYRNDTSLVEYISAGALTGALYKLDTGLVATFVGACLGSVLSTIAGLAVIGLLKLSGLSMADIRKALYKLKEARDDQYYQAQEKAAIIKNDELTQSHKLIVEQHGERNIEEIH